MTLVNSALEELRGEIGGVAMLNSGGKTGCLGCCGSGKLGIVGICAGIGIDEGIGAPGGAGGAGGAGGEN